jgi:hypothetical protein
MVATSKGVETCWHHHITSEQANAQRAAGALRLLAAVMRWRNLRMNETVHVVT